MLLRGIEDWNLDPERCVLVGDKPSDIAAGVAAGIGKLFQVTTADPSPGAAAVSDLAGTVQLLRSP